jgi:hypothetical protein
MRFVSSDLKVGPPEPELEVRLDRHLKLGQDPTLDPKGIGECSAIDSVKHPMFAEYEFG